MSILNFGVFKPLVNYNFVLRVEGIYDIPCKSIKNINNEAEYEYIQEGGVNDRVHMRKKPLSKPYSFQVERYVGTPYEDIFTLDKVFNTPVLLLVSRYQKHFEKPGRTYSFEGCRVISKDYGEFQGEQSGFLTESVTIAYDAMKYQQDGNDVEIPQMAFTGEVFPLHGNGAPLQAAAKVTGNLMENPGVSSRKWPAVSSAKKYWRGL